MQIKSILENTRVFFFSDYLNLIPTSSFIKINLCFLLKNFLFFFFPSLMYNTSEIISSIFGWVYFLAWSVSFYPQIFVNYKLKRYLKHALLSQIFIVLKDITLISLSWMSLDTLSIQSVIQWAISSLRQLLEQIMALEQYYLMIFQLNLTHFIGKNPRFDLRLSCCPYIKLHLVPMYHL